MDPDLCWLLESALALISSFAAVTALAFTAFKRSGCEFDWRFAAMSEDRWDREMGKLSRMEEDVLVGRLARVERLVEEARELMEFLAARFWLLTLCFAMAARFDRIISRSASSSSVTAIIFRGSGFTDSASPNIELRLLEGGDTDEEGRVGLSLSSGMELGCRVCPLRRGRSPLGGTAK